MRLKTAFAVLICCVCLLCFARALEKTAVFPEGGFADVSPEAWYAETVKTAYEFGLMKGVSDDLFAPDDRVTVAEAVTMASRLHASRAGERIPAKDGAWYAPYFAYAKENGLTAPDADDPDSPASRRTVAALFAKALPQTDYAPINEIDAVPDVRADDEIAAGLLTLYRAGVVVGSDAYGDFYPESAITRAEAAAMLCRAALPETRLRKTFDVLSADDAYELVLPTTYTGGKDDITSGWLLDNRGGVPRTNVTDAYGTLMDIRTDAPTAMIREFNRTDTGSLDVRTGVKLFAEKEGFYLEFQNDAGESVYRLEVVDGAWSLLGADGGYTALCEVGEGERTFRFHIQLDLDNRRASTAIDGVGYGTHPLCVPEEKTNILNFRFATTEKSTATAALEPLDISVNYAVLRYTAPSDDGMLPAWRGTSGAKFADKTVTLAAGESASVDFRPTAGKAVCECSFILPQGEVIRVDATSGGVPVVSFTTDENAFFANGETVYEGYYHNQWYRLRLELDGAAGKALIKINGRRAAEVDGLCGFSLIDGLTVAALCGGDVTFTDFRVFREAEHDDYVPRPVIPEGADDYVIGMNVCSLWKNGNHYGWSCISPYTDHELALGYYDEGNPETADWEIKYTLEHGIDFQAFCVFFGNLGGVQKLSADHLFNGFMNAKYADMAKFCIIWEATSGGAPASLEEWKTFFVPYFIENFFKDDRYIVIDGQPVVCVFSPDMLASRIGSRGKVKECFDYLEEEVARLFGYKGVIFLACGTSADKFAEMGFDGVYAYSWGTAGASGDVNKSSMVSSGDQGAVYNVPTVSVGFNSVAWHGKRYPLMTKETYRTVNEWVRDRYLDAYPTQPWQENFVMLSTWNEYGEGTFIMPTADEDGFGYLDVIREVYTKENADASLNVFPTESQKKRINRLYPQYRHLLRKEGYAVETLDEAHAKIVKTIDYGTVEGLKVWGTREYTRDENGVTGLTGIDPILQLENITDVDTADVDYIRITAKTPTGQEMMVLFITDEDGRWTEDKGTKFLSETDELTTYVIPTRSLKKWSGKLTGLRIDPVVPANLTYTVKSCELISAESETPLSMVIDGVKIDTNFRPVRQGGDTLVAFDPSTGMAFLLNCFDDWNKADGRLTLRFAGHTLTFTVGEKAYLVDGREKPLGYALETLDGLPLIPFDRLCKDVGYAFGFDDDGEITVETDRKDVLAEYYKEPVYGSFEFDKPGNTEGFASSFMSLTVSGGYMNCTSITSSNDPTILYEGKEPIRLPTDEYTKLEMRVRYDFEYRENTPDMKFKIYFATDVQNSFSEWKSIVIPLEGTSSNGEWVTYTVDLSQLKQWQNTVTALRIDPFDSQGTFDIDYLRFLKEEPAE